MNRKYKWANVYSYLGHPLMEKISILDTWYQVLIKVSNPIFDPTYCRKKAEVSSKARKEGGGVETDQWHRLLSMMTNHIIALKGTAGLL